MFNFKVNCFFCGKNVTKGKKSDVSVITQNVIQDSLLERCNKMSNEWAFDVQQRIVNCDLIAVGAKYHKVCYSKFLKIKLETNVDSDVGSTSEHVSGCVVAQGEVSVQLSERNVTELVCNSIIKPHVIAECAVPEGVLELRISNCGPATSHAQYLDNVCVQNGLRILDTVGGGDCFYNSVQLCLRDIGVHYTISELRNITAVQLEQNRAIYSPMYLREAREQAISFDVFVDQTRRNHEWAIEMCIAACARGLQRVIRVISTADGRNNKATAWFYDYDEGVHCLNNDFIMVGYNKAVNHYVGLGRVSRIALLTVPAGNVLQSSNYSVLNVVSHVFCDADNVVSNADNVHVLHSIVDNDDRVCSVDDAAAQSDDDNSGVADVSVAHDVDADDADMVYDEVNDNVASVAADAIPSNLHKQCASCKRVETEHFKLNLLLYSCKLIRKQISMLSGVRDKVVLCDLCFPYVTNKLQTMSKWKYGWASAIAYMLSNAKYQNIRCQLWDMLPARHKECWRGFAESVGINCCDLQRSAVFVDATERLSRYETMTKSGVISDFIACNDDYAFPEVRCPAGCFAYVDECACVQFHHFIAWKLGAVVFNGDAKYFIGARLDWPSSVEQLGCFSVRPSVVVDSIRGLCVLMCRHHGNGLLKSFVHVPLNPVLGDMGLQLTDTCAAAMLVPNVVRAGRMGKWTNSSHVVAAVGGYSGISSSSIAAKVDQRPLNKRLSASSCLAMNNRPDVLNTFRARCANLELESESVDYELWHYEQFSKPSVDKVLESMSGATVIDMASSFKISERMFNRGTVNNAITDVKQEAYMLSLVFVHPADGRGSKPVDMCKCYALGSAEVKTGFLLQLLVHCPTVHDVLLDEYQRTRSAFLYKLLSYVKVCVGQSKRGVKSPFETAKCCERAVNEECVRLGLANGRCAAQYVTSLLASLSEQIVSFALQAGESVGGVGSSAESAKVIVYYRTNNRRWLDEVACEFGDFHLVAVFCGAQLTNEIYFRWNEKCAFWFVKRDGKVSVSSVYAGGQRVSSLTVLKWQVLVYVKSCDVAAIDAQVSLGLKGQQVMRCAIHHQLLVKQPLSCMKQCCIVGCSRYARWLCQSGGHVSCANGVCLSHGNDLCKRDNPVEVGYGMAGRRLPGRIVPGEERRQASNAFERDSSAEDDEDDIDDRVLAPLGMAGMMDDDGPPAVHSRSDIVPVYDVNRHLSSHFLWNQKYNIMKRSWGDASTIRTNGILTHIVTMTGNACVSLLYPEGQLFPRIFWRAECDAIVGAVPSFMLNAQCSAFSHVASLAEHEWVRLRDGCLLTSKQNPYWHYLFDLKLNNCLNHATSKLVFKRGLEFLLEGGDGRRNYPLSERGSRETLLPMDESEATRRVKELASLLKKGAWDYFVTITSNDSFTPGLRKITHAIKTFAADDSNEAELTSVYLPFTLRAWERFVRVLFQELLMRNDNIIGKVKHLFYRYEFQSAGAKGNKPHVHCGVTLEAEPVETTAGRISCDTMSFHSSCYGADYETLRNLGVFSDEEEYNKWKAIVASVQHHDCSKTEFRCMKATNAEGEKICRYHRQPLPPALVAKAWPEVITMPYPDDVYELLREAGLAEKSGDEWVVDECLKAVKWHYPSYKCEFFLSSIPLLSAIVLAATNVDKTDRKFQVSYLVKYVCGKEEHQLVDVAGTKDESEIRITTEEHAHEKITSCKRIVDKKLSASKSHLGREVSLCEVVWFDLGFAYTYCTAGFVHAATLPLENRVGVMQHRKFSRFVRESNTGVIVPVHERIVANLPAWRCFTEEQIKHVEDYLSSPYIIDATSSFNIRAPELLCFDSLQVYCECFVVVKTQPTVISIDVINQSWFDGASRLVKLRSCSLAKAVAYAERKASAGNDAAAEMLRCVFRPLVDGSDDGTLRLRFVQETGVREVVSVISFVKPWDRTKFLAHLCMSLGVYKTETDLFCNGSIKDAFVKAGLLESAENVTRDDLMAILRKYVQKDLSYHPISARQFGRYLKAAYTTLHDVFENGVLGDYSPCITDVMLKEQASVVLRTKEADRRNNLVSALFDDAALADSLPLALRLQTSFQWVPSVEQAEGISDVAVAEQRAALNFCVSAIDRFVNPRCRGVKFPCLVGRPGSGKSHVLKLAVAYALSKGLSVELMSWTSERARKLGGNHVHLVFPLIVNNNRLSFSQDIVNGCVKRLDADPLKRTMLRRTDVFVFEEIGLLSAEYFVALDGILRLIMNSNLPWGGKLLLSCGDAKQLPPVDGTMIWASVNMCTMMDVFVFKADVRARDINLRFLNDQCRRVLTEDECNAACDVVMRECTFERDWSTVPDIAVRIVSTKAAELTVTEEFLAGRETKSYQAMDEVPNGVVWEPAGAHISKILNKRCYEYDVCKLYMNAVVRMTYNDRQCAHPFSQGQIAVVVGLPDESQSVREGQLVVRLAPPGVRHIEVADLPDNWPTVVVKGRTTPAVVVGRGLQMGRRTQYPVRFYICSTIHRIQGDILPLVATQVSDYSREYRLWQKEQLAVLISRVSRCRDIIFVGNRAETRAAVLRILACSSKWDKIVDHYLSVLDVSSRHEGARELVNDQHPFLPIYQELPAASCGYVFLLVSMANCERFYVGHGEDLKRSLRNINTGYGEEHTRDTTLHPWGVFAFVCGFEMSESVEVGVRNRAEFCSIWSRTSSWMSSVELAYERGKALADEWFGVGVELTIVKCGVMRR